MPANGMMSNGQQMSMGNIPGLTPFTGNSTATALEKDGMPLNFSQFHAQAMFTASGSSVTQQVPDQKLSLDK